MKKSPIIKLLELGVCILIIQIVVYLSYNLLDSIFIKHKEAMTENQKYKIKMQAISNDLEKNKNVMEKALDDETIRLAETANNIIG
tara:strand:- start:3954 stop:4211 length:258 start_codon:yes stop_codon:yes gene_type:complete